MVSAFIIFVVMNKYFIIFYFFSFTLSAQDTLMPVVFLDDVIISEENNGFSVEDFVDYVKKDTTFYMGFKHLRYYSHEYEGKLDIFNKKGSKIGSLRKWGTHYSNKKNFWLLNDSISHQGKIFKRNGKYKYYTPQAFDEVFFPKDTIPVSLKISKKENKNESQNMRDAKTVGFSIGSDDTEQDKGGVSKRLAVFDINMQKYYDYIISDTVYRDKECYVFTIKVKDDLIQKDISKALIRKLVSYFDKENFNVIYREYKFIYNHWLISLDMDIVVFMDYVNTKHVPTEIYYKGFWNVLLFKPERAEFRLINRNYIVN